MKYKEHLLIVDDDPGMQAMLADVLTSLDYQVSIYSSAIEAIEMLRKSSDQVDAIICNLNMPKMNGLKFMEAVQGMGCNIPIIFTTAFGTKILADELTKKGAYGYLSKPFQLSEISDLIRMALEYKE